jgi:hypothetical protein
MSNGFPTIQFQIIVWQLNTEKYLPNQKTTTNDWRNKNNNLFKLWQYASAPLDITDVVFIYLC